MKKVYLIFSLLLMILGINTAYAGVTWTGAITDPSTLTAGSHIVIHTNRATNETTQSYKFFSAHQDSLVYTTMSELALERFCSFTMETATGKTVKGEQAYYLKNDYNGRYISYVYDEKTSLVDGHVELQLVFTDDVNKALAVIIKPAATAVEWFNYTLTDNDKAEVTETTMMIVGECAEQSNRLIAFNSNFSQTYTATYGDWAAWWQVSNADVNDDITADLNALYEKVKDLNYIGGTAPGCYDETLVANFNSARTTAADVFLNGDPNSEEGRKALEDLENAYFALQNATEVPVHEGYFYIQSAYSGFGETKVGISAADGVLKWAPLNADDPSMLWQFIDRKDGTWLMYNVGTAQYVNGTSNNQYTLSNDSTGKAMQFVSLGMGQFNIKRQGSTPMHTNGTSTSGTIMLWDSQNLNGGSAWYITNADESKLDSLKAVGEQNRLNNELNDLYNMANEKYAIGSKFNIVTDHSKWLVTTTDLENNPLAVFSNSDHNTYNPDATDGTGYPALLDEDSTTYWHSAWKNIPTDKPFLQFELNKAVSAFAVYITKRASDNQATDIYFQVTNDTTSGEWINVGSINGLPASASADNPSSMSYQSTGFELGGEYKFVRVTWKSASGFTHFSGFHFEEASLDPNCQNATMENNAAKNLKTAMNNALTLVQAGKATQAAIDELTKAYNDYIIELADPTALKAKADSIATAMETAATPSMTKEDGTVIFTAGEPGVYTDDAKNALKTAVSEVQSYITTNEASGTFTKDGIATNMEKLNTAWATFKATAPQIQMTSATNDGIWYKISVSQHYFDYTGKAQDSQTSNDITYTRKGRLYVGVADMDNEAINNYSINVTGNSTLDELKISEDMALWRFVNVGDTAVAIQNKGTGLYIGAKTGGNAGLSITPAVFKIQELGYATFLFDGTRLDGTATSPLHVQTNGQVLVFWNNYDLGGGSCFDIEPTSSAASSLYTTPNIEEVVSGKLYAKCYPVGITTVGDGKNVIGKVYQIATIDQEKKELTLTGSMDEISAGQPFFYIAGGNTIETTTDTTLMYVELTDDKVIAKNPGTNNGLIGTYYGTTVNEGFGIIKDEEGVQSIAATTENQSIGWNTGYINGRMITNAEQPGEIKISIEGDIETAIKNAIMDAQTGNVNVYSIDGILIKKNVKVSEATKGLVKGIYIVGKKKVAIQ